MDTREKQDDRMARITELAHKNPVLYHILEPVAQGKKDYGHALEEAVIAMAEQVQTLQNTYRKHNGIH